MFLSSLYSIINIVCTTLLQSQFCIHTHNYIIIYISMVTKLTVPTI